MSTLQVPSREEVSSNNQAIFDDLKKAISFVPNLYATFAYSETALGNYLQFQNAKTSFSKKEKEAINLVVSQSNGCVYCQSAHTTIGKMNGFTEEQTIELRKGVASFDAKLNALVGLAKDITENKGRPSEKALDEFFNAGYTKGSLVDLILAIADKVIMNYLHNVTQIPVDFPLAASI